MTNVSVGRGTDRPFERVGAPWMDADAVIASLTAERLPGVTVVREDFTPSKSRFAGTRCQGLRFDVTDAAALRPVRLGVALALALRSTPPRHEGATSGVGWQPKNLMTLLGHRATFEAILAGASLESIVEGWGGDLRAFEARRRAILLYR